MPLKGYKSLRSMKEFVTHLIDVGELDRALRFIHNFVECIITEPLCTSQVFGSKDLDELCQHIGKINLAAIEKKYIDTTSYPSHPVFTYIVTKLQKSGGHSQIIEDFIKTRPEVQHVILSTELAGKSDTGYLIGRFGDDIDVGFEYAPKGNYQKKLTWLQKRILEIHPNEIYLFNHHQDSIAVAAVQPKMRLNACFYHHGDHHLCLGVYLSHLRHIDPHPMGYHNCRDALGIENVYIPLTVEDKGVRSTDWPFLKDNRLTTCTAARSNKIEVPYYVSYLEILPTLLKTTGGKHIHIGRLSPWALYRIRRGLKHHGIHRDCFIYTPWVPSVWRALHNYRVDLYIASFPYGGGLTLIEAMGAGVPVALHKHIFSRILSGIDLAYPGAFSWRSPDELLNFCSKLTPEYLERTSRAARVQYNRFHRREILEDILSGNGQVAIKPGDLIDNYSQEYDELACWMENQVSFERVIRRGIYRIFRALRARLC